MEKDRKAFTLIELLVVISIISFLSSIVLASLNTAREKGRIAAGIEQDASINHALGDRMIASWNLDENTGTTIIDNSGNNLNGTIGNRNNWYSRTQGISGKAIYFMVITYNFQATLDYSTFQIQTI